MKDLAAKARCFVRACDSGALATHSRRHPGYPFGSVVSFALDRDACPILMISRLAEHSRNLRSDARASLLVRQPSSDPQSGTRVTILADASECPPDPLLRARYLRLVPAAGELAGLGDFYFMRLKPVAIRYIGGFGAIHWIDPRDYAPPSSDIPAAEPQLIDAIESAQAAELKALCRSHLGHEPAQLELIGLDCDGLDLRAEGVRLRFDFDRPLTSAQDAAGAIAALRPAILGTRGDDGA